MARFQFLVALAFLSASSVVHAHGFDYTLKISGFPEPINGAFSFYEPALLTGETTISSTDFLSSSNAGISDITINPVSPVCPITTLPEYASCVEADFPDIGSLGQFFTVDLTSVGRYVGGYKTDIVQLTISPASNPSPEPSSIVLLATGVLGLVNVVRRRLAASEASL